MPPTDKLKKSRRLVLKRGIVLSALLAGGIGSTQAGDYSNLYFFGDSITDSGTFINVARALSPSVPNGHFSTKPGNVWSENLGARYGKSVSAGFIAYLANPPVYLPIGGNNLAVGDAQIKSIPANHGPLPSVKMQVDQFLSRGAVDPKALYAMWAGGTISSPSLFLARVHHLQPQQCLPW